MGDLISRQEAIEAICKACSMVEDYHKCDYYPETSALLCDELVALRELPSAQPESHWTPCSVRLPEERGFYLTTTKDKAVYCDHWDEDNFDRTEMVIAWMPLPEPYRGGDE